jgi:hypothetical protein
LELGFECLAESYKETPNEPFRLYLTSRILGGTLAQNNGTGWIPIFPKKPNYPLKGTWYSPKEFSERIPCWGRNRSWRESVLAALNPEQYLCGANADPVGRRTAIEYSSKRCNQFRAFVVIALIKKANGGCL